MTTERDRLLEKLRRIEALYAGAGTEGERAAAGEARQRIAARLAECEQADPPIEYHFTVNDPWTRKLLLALLRRYGIEPYRYHRQRNSSVMARVSRSFVTDTLWPEFQELAAALGEHLSRVTDDIIHQGIAGDTSEPEEVAGLLEGRPTSMDQGGFAMEAERTQPQPTSSAARTPGRNDPCPCGSGRKYKKCCGASGQVPEGAGGGAPAAAGAQAGASRAQDVSRCGLCGKSERLTKTECCGNWICDDEDSYRLFSYERNSCARNHRRFTLCGSHSGEGHAGAWQDCAECRDDIETELYVYYGTNEYNFEKLQDPPAYEPTRCSKCGRRIALAEDGYSQQGGKYTCAECGEDNQRLLRSLGGRDSRRKGK